MAQRVKPNAPLPVCRLPQQARGRASLERILSAAEEVLREKSFDHATLQEIVERAGYTVGAFYARFEDKEALLREMERRLYVESDRLLGRVASPEAWRTMPLAEGFRRALKGTLEVYRARPGTLRALVQRSRTDATLRRRLLRMNRRNVDAFLSALLARQKEIRHPNPRAAAEFGLLVVVGALREAIVFHEFWPRGVAWPDGRLVEELARLYLDYLGVREER